VGKEKKRRGPGPCSFKGRNTSQLNDMNKFKQLSFLSSFFSFYIILSSLFLCRPIGQIVLLNMIKHFTLQVRNSVVLEMV
jgi:hypothetical protein